MASKRVAVISESDSGRNLQCRDNRTGQNMTRAKFVREIERGNYEDFHIRLVNGLKTPVSNPDGRVTTWTN